MRKYLLVWSQSSWISLLGLPFKKGGFYVRSW